jgi:phage/plasmid-associated DNA primase
MEATSEYLSEEDVRAQWLAERTVKDPNAFTTSSDLYSDWMQWAPPSQAVGTQIDFGRWLSKQGYVAMKKKERGFLGLALRPAEEGEATDQVSKWDR